MDSYVPINFRKKLAKFTDHWSPKIIAEMNDYQFKLVKLQGEFVWHDHKTTDEVFIILRGEMDIEFRDGVAHVCEGEMFVVPKGVEHRTRPEPSPELMVCSCSGSVPGLPPACFPAIPPCVIMVKWCVFIRHPR